MLDSVPDSNFGAPRSLSTGEKKNLVLIFLDHLVLGNNTTMYKMVVLLPGTKCYSTGYFKRKASLTHLHVLCR